MRVTPQKLSRTDRDFSTPWADFSEVGFYVKSYVLIYFAFFEYLC